jgi:hypothetical protein
VLTIENILTPDRFDEETITSAFLGALAGGLPWIADAVGTQQDDLAPISWGHYAKSRSKQAGVKAEVDYGADFALAVRIGDDLVRVALFQAKRPKLGEGSDILIFKDSGHATERTRQFLRLRKTAYDLLRDLNRETDDFVQLTWIHYVGYVAQSPRTVPMSDLIDHHHAVDGVSAGLPPPFPMQEGHRPLMNLMLAACGADADEGWLEMTVTQANAYLPHLSPLMPIFSADEGRGDRRLLPEVSTVVATASPKPALQEPTPTPSSSSRPKF